MGMKGTQIIASQGRPKNRRSWPKTTPDEYSDSWDDGVKEDGTDYIGKSFEEHAAGYPVLIDGIDASPVLHDVVKSLNDTLLAFEANMNEQIDRAFDEAIEFDRHLGKSVHSIGIGVAELGERVVQLEEDTLVKSVGSMATERIQKSMPIGGGGPITYLEKQGFGEGSPDRQEILEAMVKSVEAGELEALEVIKFESSGVLSPQVKKSLGLS